MQTFVITWGSGRPGGSAIRTKIKFHTYTIQRPVFNIWGITLTKQRDGFIFHSSCQQVRMAPIVAQNIQSSPWPVQIDTASVRFWKLNTTSWYVAADQNSWWRLYHSMYISVLVTWAFLKCKQQKTSMNLCRKGHPAIWILACPLPTKLEWSFEEWKRSRDFEYIALWEE